MSRFALRVTTICRPVNLRRGLALLAGASILTASGVLVAIGAPGAANGVPGAKVTGPQPVDRQVTVAVASLLKKEHLSRHPIDNDISRRWLKMYLKTLDPMKVYFTQEDVDAFTKKQDELDDLAKRGDIAFGHEVFKVFLQRIDERVKLVDQLLQEKHDFTVDEDMATDPEATSFAKNDKEVREMWRKRVKYDFEVLKADNEKKADKDKLEGAKAIEKLSRRYQSFAKRMRQTDNDEVLEMYLTALTTSFDPHTTYMSPDSYKNFEIQMKLNLDGIGAALQFKDGFTEVSKIIPNGAAAKDGRLKPLDKVVGVGQGENGEITDVIDMKLNDVVKQIRGTAGSVVRLQVQPEAGGDKQIYNIVRAKIELTDSEARSQIFDVKRPDGSTIKVGAIDLPSFYMDMNGAREGVEDFKSTTRDVARLLKEFNEKNVEAVIIDLRHNGGGSLTEAINLTGLFIDNGPVVQVKDADGRVQHYDDMEKGMAWNGPLVVMTSKFSASASEIFAGAIQDYKRGLIVGDTSTHGKGTVQSLLNLGQQLFRIQNAPELGALKITMQQFYRPNGDSTQNRGVLADVELPSLTSQLDVGESSLDYAVKFDHVDKLPYQTYNLVEAPLVEQLRTASSDRRKTSKDFDKVLKNITRYNEQKARKKVSLNEQKFMADRNELNAEKEEEKEFEEQNDPNRPVIKNDFYFQEVLAITQDYLRLLKTPQAAAIGKR